MGSTFDYSTGKIKRGFHFVRDGEPCKKSGLPCWVGSERCEKCKHYAGIVACDGFFVKCTHPESKDSKGSGKAIWEWEEKFKYEALCALDG